MTNDQRRSANDQRLVLRKFIYGPAVLASVDQDYFGKLAVHPPAFPGHQHDRETVTPAVPLAVCDFEGAVRAAGKELLYLVGIPGVAYVVAEQDRARFQVSRLPGVQEAIGSSQGENIARIFRGRPTGMRMMGACGPCRKREEQEQTSGAPEAHARAVLPTGTGRQTPAPDPVFVDMTSKAASRFGERGPVCKVPTAIVLGWKVLVQGAEFSFRYCG
jgi:hypothetical protein